MKKKLVIVSAALEGGALTILTQFLNSIPLDKKKSYVLFVSDTLKLSQIVEGFECYYIDTSKWSRRIYYDFYGYSLLIRRLKLSVEVCINFQNIPCRLDKIKQIVYMHQSLPFYEHNWNIFDKSELKYWLYSKFYAYFIKLYKESANYFIVQANWIADALSKKITYNRENILVFKPGVLDIFQEISDDPCNLNEMKFIYPAADYKYKNHDVVIDAIHHLGSEYLKRNNIVILFTVGKDSRLKSKVDCLGLSKHILFIGSKSAKELNDIYNSSYSLIFASKIESFGLPLVEAACKGLYIIAPSLPYAKEAIEDYDHVYFADPDDVSMWVDAIKKSIEQRSKVRAKFSYKDDWDTFNLFIESVCKNN
ncbi:glycosyltransferase [Pseudocitrobacter faecalis]|uniref:glycosyltransferase n=2 Tax=Pseudocitrobacter faecalis TaxID=1398493 RepID=UPI003BA1866E